MWHGSTIAIIIWRIWGSGAKATSYAAGGHVRASTTCTKGRRRGQLLAELLVQLLASPRKRWDHRPGWCASSTHRRARLTAGLVSAEPPGHVGVDAQHASIMAGPTCHPSSVLAPLAVCHSCCEATSLIGSPSSRPLALGAEKPPKRLEHQAMAVLRRAKVGELAENRPATPPFVGGHALGFDHRRRIQVEV